MAHARYYRFGGEPMAYMANWSGLPPAANRRGNRELGGCFPGLGAIPRHERTLHSVPLRPSGPEPLDPGEMPAWQRASAYRANYMVQPVGADEAPASGPFGLSRNETRLAGLALAGAVGLFLWKRSKKKR